MTGVLIYGEILHTVPTTTGYVVQLLTFGQIAQVSTSGVQRMSLGLPNSLSSGKLSSVKELL